MAITYPRTLPCGVQSVTLEPSYSQAMNRSRSGEVGVLELADPRWQAQIAYAPLDRERFQAMRAWLDSARGALVRVLVHDALQPYPLLYPKAVLEALSRAGGGAFDGTATVTALGPTGVTLGALPPNFALKAGDYVGLVEGGRYGLLRVAEDATGSGGGSLALTGFPLGQTKHFTTGAQARLVRPPCLMTLDPASVSAARSAGQRAPVSFNAVQYLA